VVGGREGGDLEQIQETRWRRPEASGFGEGHGRGNGRCGREEMAGGRRFFTFLPL